MTKTLSLIIVLILLFVSCKNDKKDKKLNQKGIELTAKENNIEFEIEKNTLYCENEKFIIKINDLGNDNFKYISWNKPKTTSDKPDLVLQNGKAERQGTMGGYHYLFNNGEWDYIVEDNLMGEDETVGVFLNLLKNGKQKLYTKINKVTDLSNINSESLNMWLKVGVNQKEILNKLGKPDSLKKEEILDAIGLYVEEWKYNDKGISLSMASKLKGANKTVLYINITKPCSYKTSKNIGIDSHRDEITKAYSKYIDNVNSNETQIIAGSVYEGIVFTFENDKVSNIFFGALSE